MATVQAACLSSSPLIDQRTCFSFPWSGKANWGTLNSLCFLGVQVHSWGQSTLSFMGKCWPCRDGLFSCQLVLFTKVVKWYVSILTVVVRGAACITGPLCICANKNRHAAVYSSSFTKDSTYVSEQWLQWLHLLVINHNCYAAEMHVQLTLENNPAIQRHHKSIADILDLCFSC